MKANFGLHIPSNAQDESQLMRVLQQLQPEAITITENLALAQQVKKQLPRTLTIFRPTHQTADRWHEQMTPATWLARYGASERGGLVLACLDDPTLTPNLIDWCCELIDLASADGIKLCLLNLDTSQLDADRIAAGAFDELLYALDRCPEHVLGVQEYGVLPTDPDEAPTIGGFTSLLDRAFVLGLLPPQVVVTRYSAAPPGSDWRTQVSAADYTKRLIAGLAIYQEYGVPVCVDGYSLEVDGQALTNEDPQTLFDGLIAYNRTAAGLPPLRAAVGPDYLLAEAPSEYVTVRQLPEVDGAVLGEVQIGEVVTYYGELDGWAYIETEIVQGWVDLLGGAVKFILELDLPMLNLSLPEIQRLARLHGEIATLYMTAERRQQALTQPSAENLL